MTTGLWIVLGVIVLGLLIFGWFPFHWFAPHDPPHDDDYDIYR